MLILFTLRADWPVLRGLETASLDLRFRLRGPIPPADAAVVVLADDDSLAAFGRWPFSRRLLARAVDAAFAAGARLVAFDLLFPEAEQAGPGDDPDGALQQALARHKRVLLPIAFVFTGKGNAAADYLSDSGFQRFGKSDRPAVFPLQPIGAVTPIERLGKAALGLGNVNIVYDRDGGVRHDRSVLPFEGDFYPSLAVRAAAEYLGIDWNAVEMLPGRGVRFGERLVPTDQAMRLPINFLGPPGTIPTISFAALLNGDMPADLLRGRVVLIGASFTGAKDSFVAPFSVTPMPGTEILATIVDMIASGRFLSEEDPAPWRLPGFAAILLLAAVTGAASHLRSLWRSAAVGLFCLAALLAALQFAFDQGVWLPAARSVAALATAFLLSLLMRYWMIDRSRRHIRAAFRRYMSPDMVEILAAQPEKLALGGETRTMTVMFCDLRGFTTISERFQADPQGLTRLVNRFFTAMTEIIMGRRGTIDKYMGDCIMAFWNAPLDDPEHGRHALLSALAMNEALTALNRQLASEGLPLLAIGIGLNSGACVVGNMGSDLRYDYSVIGDSVNLASRLEGLSKIYGVTTIVGPQTREAAPDFAFLELDLIAVKGKTEPVHIFGLMGDRDRAESEEFRRLAARHRAMIEAYRRRDWQAARGALAECRAAGGIAELYDLYQGRIAEFERDPPDPGWNGVHIAPFK